ncbi:hypothetical protein [Exiguobacterium sp. s102]|uniref:hypothetical protein n=1 Tax=Exiguobacterium sp. s102 TaxID=2751212 RepID=UPI001BE78B11|nr:hypothetical protein [Exiguobacterium sp. s102]
MKSFDVAADTIIVHEQYDLNKRKQDGILPFDSKQSDFTYELSDRHSTVASFRFLSRDRVIFRENTSQLLYADLTRGTVAPLTEMEDTMSKPIYVNRTIAYAVSDGQDVTFHVIDVTP